MADTQTLDMNTRVARIEARGAIADLIHRYAFNIRNSAFDDFAALFAADVEFQVRDADPAGPPGFTVRNHHIGREAVLAYLTAPGRTGLRIVPMIRNLLVQLDDNTATSTCLMNSRSWPAGAEVFGEYHDSFRFEGEWRFTSRVFTIFKKPAPVS